MNPTSDFERTNSFTYVGWEVDAKMCEKFVISGRDRSAKKKLRGMQNKQQMYDGCCSDPNIMRLRSGEFNYNGFEKDTQYIIKSFGAGENIALDMIVLEMKQRAQVGDRSHPILQEIDSATFDYRGWEEDFKKVENFFFNVNCICIHASREEGARAKLDLMYKKQMIHDSGSSNNPLIQRLHSSGFTYPSSDKDKKRIIEEYQAGFYVGFMIDIMELRQKLFEGCSHPILTALDTTPFTYDGWEKDAAATKRTLMESEFDSFLNDPRQVAQRGLKAMGVKQQIHEGNDIITKLIEGKLFTYEGHEQDEMELKRFHMKGYEVSDYVQDIIRKQQFHNNAHTHPILSLLRENGAICQNKDQGSPSCKNGGQNDESSFGRCIICLQHPKTHAFVPCGHLTLCDECAILPNFSLKKKERKCPICRKDSTMLMKVYG